ncbi:MAG: hypothetical protein AAF628_03155 [Planctomycetota bacterium]
MNVRSLLAALTVTSVACAQDINLPPPDLAPGEPYRVLFVTDGSYSNASSDIGVYNARVVTEAEAVPALAALSTSWTAVGSTAAVDARTNTQTDPTPSGPTGVPIYRPDGVRVADDYDHLWGAATRNLLIAPLVSPSGRVVPAGGDCHTGSSRDGTRRTGQELGQSGVGFGILGLIDSQWIESSAYPRGAVRRLFGLSGVLTAPAARADGQNFEPYPQFADSQHSSWWAYRLTASSALTIRDLSLFTKSAGGAQDLSVGLYRADPVTGAIVAGSEATATVPVDDALGWYSATWSAPFDVQPGEHVYVGVRATAGFQPVLRNGDRQPSYLWSGSWVNAGDRAAAIRLTTATGEVISANDLAPDNLERSQFHAMAATADRGRLLTHFDVYTQSKTGAPVTLNAPVYRATASGEPESTRAAQGAITIGPERGWYTAILDEPILVDADETFYLALSPSADIYQPTLRSGERSPSYLWDGSAWVPDGERASVFRLGGGTEAASLNADAGTPTSGTLAGGSLSGFYAYQMTAPRDMTLGHVAFYMQSTGIQTINCPIYLDAGGAPASSRTAETPLQVHPAAAWYAGSYNAPVQLAAGDVFWVGVSLRSSVVPPLLTSGTATPAYRWDGTQWIDDGMQIPAIRLLSDDSTFVHTGHGCTGSNGAMPYLTADAFRTGNPAQIRLAGALPSSIAALTFGTPQTLRLDALGAPGCTARTSLAVSLLVATDTAGAAQLDFSVPQQPALIGATLDTQALVADAAASQLGIVASTAHRLAIE